MGKHKRKKQRTVSEVVEVNTKALYLCDRRACGDQCPNSDCYLTHDISHAMNFKQEGECYVEQADRDETLLLQLKDQCKIDDINHIYDRLVQMKKYGIVLLPKDISIQAMKIPNDSANNIGF